MTKFALLIIHTKINIGRAEDGLGYFFFCCTLFSQLAYIKISTIKWNVRDI